MTEQAKTAAANALLKWFTKAVEDVMAAGSLEDHYGVPISVFELAGADPQLVQALTERPIQTIQLLDAALVSAQHILLSKRTSGSTSMQIKQRVHARLHRLPWAMDTINNHYNPSIGRLRSFHLNELLTLQGTVIRTCAVRMLESEQTYECTKCKERITITSSLEAGTSAEGPTGCPNQQACNSTKFQKLERESCYTAYQEIRVQEKGGDVSSVPASLTIILQHDLADCCQPGDDIEVTGVLIPRCGPFVVGRRSMVEPVLLACHLHLTNKLKSKVLVQPDIENIFEEFWQVHEDTPMLGRNKILANICPQICSMFSVKLATALTLLGGVPRKAENGTRIRGDVHTLLIGDPGTGKSQMMRFAARLSPRAVVTTGKSSSGAGLTVSAVKVDGQWTLEAGALVLADGGLCCIDEFGCIKEADRAMIHEAMEQQTLSVAKAGMVTTLSTRAAVLGITNPKGVLTPGENLTHATTLSSPMLSRFDIVLLLANECNQEWHRQLSDHMINAHSQAAPSAHAAPSVWGVSVLKAYIAWARARFQPVLTPAAEAVLLGYYRQLRQGDDRCAGRTTIRMLEGLVRIAQAHARLMARPVVGLSDAVVAVYIVEAGQSDPRVLPGHQNALYSAFPADPDEEHARQRAAVLTALNLQGLVAGGSGGEYGLGRGDDRASGDELDADALFDTQRFLDGDQAAAEHGMESGDDRDSSDELDADALFGITRVMDDD